MIRSAPFVPSLRHRHAASQSLCLTCISLSPPAAWRRRRARRRARATTSSRPPGERREPTEGGGSVCLKCRSGGAAGGRAAHMASHRGTPSVFRFFQGRRMRSGLGARSGRKGEGGDPERAQWLGVARRMRNARREGAGVWGRGAKRRGRENETVLGGSRKKHVLGCVTQTTLHPPGTWEREHMKREQQFVFLQLWKKALSLSLSLSL